MRGICLCKFVLWVRRSKPGRSMALPPYKIYTGMDFISIYFLYLFSLSRLVLLCIMVLYSIPPALAIDVQLH